MPSPLCSKCEYYHWRWEPCVETVIDPWNGRRVPKVADDALRMMLEGHRKEREEQSDA